MSVRQSCKNCVFKRERSIGAYGATSMVSECRRAPPAKLDVSNYGLWPRVMPEDWCGQWSPDEEVREQVAAEFAAERASRMAHLKMLVDGGEDV